MKHYRKSFSFCSKLVSGKPHSFLPAGVSTQTDGEVPEDVGTAEALLYHQLFAIKEFSFFFYA